MILNNSTQYQELDAVLTYLKDTLLGLHSDIQTIKTYIQNETEMKGCEMEVQNEEK